MRDVAISVEKLGKRYRIGSRQRRYDTLREAVTLAVQAPLRVLRRRAHENPETIWALRDVSFGVAQGEVLGVIGRNGAGKSTLLKILARVTYPTVGHVEIVGRVGSLLEVGTGFHPELTGWENIYLSGAVLGMRRAEIRRKFDEIVAFAEVERFLDTPVKRYSSGMYMRLAFSIAAHLEPEILVVDEVLAVGDVAFQKKCLGKMGRVAHEGRTVLFVSHNMPAVLSLCHRALLLDRGRVVAAGAPSDIVKGYLESDMSSTFTDVDSRTDRSGDGSARITTLTIESTDEDKIIRSTSCLRLTIGYRSERPMQRPQFVVSIYDHTDIGIYLLHNEFVGGLPEVLPPQGTVTCMTDRINLTPGRCVVHVELLKGNVRADLVSPAGWFDVHTTDVFGSGMLPTRDWVVGILGQRWWLNDDGSDEAGTPG